MNNFNPESSQIPPIYGASALYTEQPQGDDARDGVIPLDTLPAQWWNWLWNNITNYCNSIVQPELENIFTELSNVLAAENLTPDDVTPNQLATAVIKIHERIATAQTAGSVKSSNDKGKVSVDSSTGVMTANGLGNIDNLTTTIKTSVVAAVNELKSTIDGFIAGAVTGVKGGNESTYRTGQVNLTPANIGAQPAGSYKTTQTAVTDPTAAGNSTTFIDTITQNTNGVITATKKTIQSASTTQSGIVQLSNSYDGTSETAAVTEKALKDGLASKQNSSTILFRLYKPHTSSYRESVTLSYVGCSMRQNNTERDCGVLNIPYLQIIVEWSGSSNVNETPLMDLLIGTTTTDDGTVIYVYPGTGISAGRVFQFTFQHEYEFSAQVQINKVTLRLYDMTTGGTLLDTYSENYSSASTISGTISQIITKGINTFLQRNDIAPILR